MSSGPERNREGLTWQEWVRASGQTGHTVDSPVVPILVQHWSDGVDPSDWRSTGPKRFDEP